MTRKPYKPLKQEPSTLYVDAKRLGMPPKKVGHAVHFLRSALTNSMTIAKVLQFSTVYRNYLVTLDQFPLYMRGDYELDRSDFMSVYNTAAAKLRIAESMMLVAPTGVDEVEFLERFNKSYK